MSMNEEKIMNKDSSEACSPKEISILPLIILVIVVFLLQTGMREIVKVLAPSGNFLKLMTICQLLLAIFLPVCLALIILRLPARPALGLHPPPWIKTILAVILGFGLIIAVNSILPLLIQPSQKYIASTASIVTYSNLPEFLLTFLTISIFAPASDEVFFRGILLRGLVARYGNLVAILATAILTALFHTLEPFKLTHAFIMGVIFASSVVWTRSVYTSFILHALHNALALIPQS